MTSNSTRFVALGLVLGLASPLGAQMTHPSNETTPGPIQTNIPPAPLGGCEVDQSSLTENAPMARFSQTDLAQSFTPAVNDSCGARIKLREGFGNGLPGDVTIELWDALPNAGGVLLASGTVLGVSANEFAEVTWPSVPIVAGTEYFLVFTCTNGSLAVAGDTTNPYPGGIVYANPGYGPFPFFDYTFETLAEGGAGVPALRTWGLIALAIILTLMVAQRSRRQSHAA